MIQDCNSSGLSNREFCRQRGISEKTYDYWLRKPRSQMEEAAAPQLVQMEPPPTPIQDEVLQIRYWGAELKLPVGVDMDAVAALLRSLQSLWSIWEKSAIITSPAAIWISALVLTVWRRWSHNSSAVIWMKKAWFSSAADGRIVSRHCTGQATDISWCTRGSTTDDSSSSGRKRS